MFKYLLVFTTLCWSLLLVSQVGECQPASNSHCEWANCGSSSTATSASSSSSLSSPPLPPCGGSDRAQCSEQCRNSYGDEHNPCIANCLGKICKDQMSRSEWIGGDRDTGALCIEIESLQCVSDCKGSPQRTISRCRRDCLSRRCPEAGAADVAEESLDPGIHACERCRKKEQDLCVRQCRAGVYIGPNSEQSGLIGLGCEKACIAAICSKSCGMRLP